MKKIHLLLLSVTLCVFSACHNDIWDAIDGLDSRVTKLEELCKEMNTNITSLQTIVDVLQSNDFITGVVEIKKDGEVIGYTITFGKHDPITIYHGKDGQNGADGKDGITPVIGIAQDTDGVYYWTLNGEWLLDDNGNKLPVSGKDGQNGSNGSNGQDGTDGKDGQDGEDGKDGADGQDGKDGITPQLKIEDGYWYISYDNGATWTQLGKATGEDGKDGQNGVDGKDGKDGDSMFQSVTQDENYVYFTLADGTVIKIAKGNGNSQSNDDFIFTITYDPNGGEGIMEKDTFYYGLNTTKKLTCSFTRNNHYFVNWNSKHDGSGVSYPLGIEITIDKNITLYAQWKKTPGTPSEYIDLGLSVKWASCNIGASSPEEDGDYFAWGEVEPKEIYDWSSYKWCNGSLRTLIKYCMYSDYGLVDNKATLEPEDDAATYNWGGSWRMPTRNEIEELSKECTWKKTSMNGIYGVEITGPNGNSIFLPRDRYETRDKTVTFSYWSSSLYTGNQYAAGQGLAWELGFNIDASYSNVHERSEGLLVRPVCP